MTDLLHRDPVASDAPRPPRARDPRAPFELTRPVLPPPRATRGYDLPLAGIALALSLVGAVLVWAATREQQVSAHADPQAFLYRHLVNIVIAAGLMLFASRLDSRLLRLFGPVVYVGGILGLLLVFVAGSTINGAHAWIVLPGGFELQPSEFCKLGLIVGMAVMFTHRTDDWDGSELEPTTRDVLRAIGLLAVPFALIMLQPDLGSAMVLACAAFGVLVTANVPARWTIGLLTLGIVTAVVAVKIGVLADYQLARFTIFTNPDADVQGVGYNYHQAWIAIANGGLFGTGLFDGPQTNGGFVPEQQTDFVFSVAGEELGLVGGAAIIVLVALLCWRGLRIARHADAGGRLVAAGVVCWIAFQSFQNIGMNLGLTPITGVPLPFVSYGGSSMFAQGLALGLLQAVHRRSRLG
ncbi:rod shape determining protein RodA [Jatrophihabitans endophyticus]|uniref:peptidoglycan glycosyltransferase n=1 Tax=Jatrophihabitans endophyticus TaxID=1206085 RepID=A0A1M5UQP3_9ACTN|nr:FtsW/RodA/SpoVE family cell cycle protein [Jatrophihabitans endophyticus]SHH65226.1 rod shape determining protein RodA [Jatrophihabitans endophyticus]